MWFEQRLIGSMANFGYVIGDPATKIAAVFDPSFDARVLQKAAAEHGYSIALIFNTHHHVDHVFDNERLADETGGKIAAHRLSNVRKDLVLEDGTIVSVGDLKVKVVHTPGHSPDSCCFIVAGRVFTGDCLFVGDCGRVDLPGSSVPVSLAMPSRSAPPLVAAISASRGVMPPLVTISSTSRFARL